MNSFKAQRAAVVLHAKAKGGQGSAPAKADKASGSASGGGADVTVLGKQAEKDADERMKKALSVVSDNFNTVRTGRANAAVLDRIMVDYYGTPTPLKQVAAVSVPDASTLAITPYDKGMLKEIEKAINESDLGINPGNDGERVRLAFPQMTQERRKELAKQVAKMGEDGKVAVRNVRKDVLKKAEKIDFSKDQKKGFEDSIQKITDGYIKKVEDVVKAKTEEVMKV